MDAVHVADDRHSARGRRLGAGLELLAVVVGLFSLMVLSLHVQAIIALSSRVRGVIEFAWLLILIAGIMMGLFGALSLLWRSQVHLVGALAFVMALAEVGANLVLADFDVARIFIGYPEALGGQFGTESLIAAWRFPLTVFIVLVYLLWLRDRPRRHRN